MTFLLMIVGRLWLTTGLKNMEKPSCYLNRQTINPSSCRFFHKLLSTTISRSIISKSILLESWSCITKLRFYVCWTADFTNLVGWNKPDKFSIGHTFCKLRIVCKDFGNDYFPTFFILIILFKFLIVVCLIIYYYYWVGMVSELLFKKR